MAYCPSCRQISLWSCPLEQFQYIKSKPLKTLGGGSFVHRCHNVCGPNSGFFFQCDKSCSAGIHHFKNKGSYASEVTLLRHLRKAHGRLVVVGENTHPKTDSRDHVMTLNDGGGYHDNLETRTGFAAAAPTGTSEQDFQSTVPLGHNNLHAVVDFIQLDPPTEEQDNYDDDIIFESGSVNPYIPDDYSHQSDSETVTTDMLVAQRPFRIY